MRPPAAVLWDMDGTIVDTEPYWIAAEHEVVESFGGRWSDELARRCVGQPLPASARLIREHTPVDLPPEQIVDRLLASVIDATRARVPWRPGARELLRECAERGVPCALVTMSYRSFAQVLLDALPAGTSAAVNLALDTVLGATGIVLLVIAGAAIMPWRRTPTTDPAPARVASEHG